VTDIERALRKAGVPCRVEEHHHSSHWTRHEGRVIAEWTDKKEALIRKVAQKLEVRK
jgi:signal recognition particle subunit SRP19